MMVVTSQAVADEATCKRILNDCNAALNAEIQENNLQKQIISDQDKQHQLDTQEIQSLQDRDSAWYRQPYVWFIVGALSGGYLVSQVQK